MENHNANSHIHCWRKNIDMIPCLTYLLIQYWISWNIFLVVSTIVLQLFVSGFLTVVFLSHFLSWKTIWDNAKLMIMWNKNEWLKGTIESNWFITKHNNKSAIQKWKFLNTVYKFSLLNCTFIIIFSDKTNCFQ